MTFSLPRFAIGLAMLAITVLAIVGVATRQFNVDVTVTVPGPAFFPCDVEIFFFHRKTMCPAPLNLASTVRTPRDDGFFGCVAAWDQFQAGFAFTILGIVFAGLSFMLYLGSAFVPVGARVFPLWVLAGLVTASAVFFTIAWPLVESLESVGFCGTDFVGTAFVSNGAPTTVTNVKKDYGHSLIIAAWCVSVVTAIAAIALVIWAKKHPEAAHPVVVKNKSVNEPVDAQNVPAA
eukprot:GILI01003723.1.p1 GENE.GILI01003723.1~~GILI01003723.1.p1  ORF type:complete len:255 (+),score=69.27 GILI01003723.1:66-767(+)